MAINYYDGMITKVGDRWLFNLSTSVNESGSRKRSRARMKKRVAKRFNHK